MKALILILFFNVTTFYAQAYKDPILDKDYTLTTLIYHDNSRHRDIPIAIYTPANKMLANNIPVIFNHGWGGNQGGDYLIYSYLTSYLATKGYYVISIQHELSTDPALAMERDFKETRLPNWQQGVENIEVVLRNLKKDYPKLQYDKLVLIGHSNGGDMASLYTQLHPNNIHTFISLDNRRMPLPRTLQTRVFSLRSNDFPPDEGVLPTKQEAVVYNITVQPTSINHGQMDDKANAEQRTYISTKLSEYLKH